MWSIYIYICLNVLFWTFEDILYCQCAFSIVWNIYFQSLIHKDIARLPCLVDLDPTLESAVQVEAFPDCGTSCSIISDDSENLKLFQKSEMFAKSEIFPKIWICWPKIWNFSENLKIVEKSEKFPKIWKISENLKSFWKSEKFLKNKKLSKNLKIFWVENFRNFWKILAFWKFFRFSKKI